jgi:heat-inducible transcriptional repressor
MTLDGRKGRILQAIVNDYVETAEPIGSEWLVTRYDFGCKSATLRNEMAEMSDRGYLLQPHTSAGRIPSNRGYRYYVDCLMTAPDSPAERRAVAADRGTGALDVDELIQLTCRLLADMTQYPSVATTPIAATNQLRRLYVTQASARHILLVLLFSSGYVEHRLIEVTRPVADTSLERATNFLNSILSGREVRELAQHVMEGIPPELAAERSLVCVVHSVVTQAAQELTDNHVFLEGTNHILRQREFQDVLRLEQLLTALEQRSVLFQVFSRAMHGNEVTIIIGDESPVQAMADCSVVTSPYTIAGRACGFIGVVGPTRMRYDRAVSAVGMMAQNLSTLLTRASLE